METENPIVSEDKVLDHVQIKCSKHGDITKGSLFLSYTTVQEEKQINHQNFFCIQCLSEYLDKLQKTGEFGQLELIRFFRDKTEDDQAAESEEESLQNLQRLDK